MPRQEPHEWLTSMRGKRCVKILCGIRGVGKTSVMASWRDGLIASGYPEERVVSIDAEDPVLRRLVTADDVLRYLATQLPPAGPVVLILEEPTSFHDYERTLGELLGQRRIDIYLTLSSRRVASEGLSGYLRGATAAYEILPAKDGDGETSERLRARWNEILLRDVLSAKGVADGNIAERLTAFLADSVGEPISLRLAAAAISPQAKVLSPNTVEAYLSALEDAYVIERCYRWDPDLEEPLARDYRVFFTDPGLCRECFGVVPDSERRVAMNLRWLDLRREHGKVYLSKTVSGLDPAAFVVADGRHVRKDAERMASGQSCSEK